MKVKIRNPDDYLRPEMNCKCCVCSGRTAASTALELGRVLYIPTSAVKDNAVFVVSEGKAVKRAVKTGAVLHRAFASTKDLSAGKKSDRESTRRPERRRQGTSQARVMHD